MIFFNADNDPRLRGGLIDEMQSHLHNIFFLAVAKDQHEITQYMTKNKIMDKWEKIYVTENFPKIKYKTGDTGLHVAAKNNSYKAASILVQKCPNDVISKINSENKNALYIAIEEGHLKVLKAMVDEMLKLKDKWDYDIDQGESLMHAVLKKSNWKEFLEALVPLYKDAVKNMKQSPTQEWKTPLYLAVKHGKTEMVAYLLKNLPELKDIPDKDNLDKLYPIHQVMLIKDNIQNRLDILYEFYSSDKQSLNKKTGMRNENIMHLFVREKGVKYTEEQLKFLKKYLSKELYISDENNNRETPKTIAKKINDKRFEKCFVN